MQFFFQKRVEPKDGRATEDSTVAGKRLSRRDRVRMKKREEREVAQRELLLNARGRGHEL